MAVFTFSRLKCISADHATYRQHKLYASFGYVRAREEPISVNTAEQQALTLYG